MTNRALLYLTCLFLFACHPSSETESEDYSRYVRVKITQYSGGKIINEWVVEEREDVIDYWRGCVDFVHNNSKVIACGDIVVQVLGNENDPLGLFE
jgi:hypothetical protein